LTMTTTWHPYTIPSTPNVGAGENYALSAAEGAQSGKNPSQFLEWREVLPKGKDNDMLKWSGDKWIPFSPSGSSENPHYLNYNGNTLSWDPVGFPEGSTKGDLLYWDPAAGDGGDWVVLAAPSSNGSILYWNENSWNFLAPPSGSGLKVLTATGGELAWNDTEDCE
jgi:hypothetical protein